MKKLIIILLMLLALPTYSQVKLSAQTAITSLSPTDIMWWNTDVGGVFTHRKMTWAVLAGEISDTMNSKTNTWALKQTFSSGATFSAGANGTVSFADSVLMPSGSSLWVHWIQRSAVSSIIGNYNAPFFTIYAQHFTTTNLEGNDSCVISYDDSTLTFDKKISVGQLSITESFAIPDSATFNAIALSETGYAFSAITDSVVTLATPSSSIVLRGFGFSITPGVDSLVCAWAGNGQLLTITNEVAFTVIIEDSYPDDGNIDLSADWSMAQGDILTLKYNSSLHVWREVSKSDKSP